MKLTPWRQIFAVFVVLALSAAACTSTNRESTPPAPSGTDGTEGSEQDAPVDQIDSSGEIVPDPSTFPDLELALVWHQHQPRYPTIDGTASRPWVRLHAAKDYVDMVTLAKEFPELRMTVNLTPVLMDQLVELEAGLDDRYEQLAKIPSADLTREDERFIVERFFDINGAIIDLSDRYQELQNLRNTGGDFSKQDIRDLRTLFHLYWLDPELRAENPVTAALATDDRGFTDEDTLAVLAVIDEQVAAVLPAHAEAWESGQVELITTPLAHPILPLIADSDLARVGDPAALLPREPYREYLDAEIHVQRGLERATELLGSTPNGMWPGEGAVAQAVMPIFADAGVEWVATGEDVLAKSLLVESFSRNEKGTVLDASDLYKPYTVQTSKGPVSMFFRDNRLSDLIGFEYSGSNADDAAADFMNRLNDIRARLAQQGVKTEDAPLVTVILDGENAWENYPNDGRDFLRALYGRLTSTDWLTTTTPSEFLDQHPDAQGEIAEVFPAAWFSPDFGTWIGEAEEARAWELLRFARFDLREAERLGASATQVANATEAMLSAEGSDWFWWYGADQDSGDDRYFDDAYRELLGQVYDALGRERPRWVGVPIIPDARVVPVVSNGEPMSIRIDGNPSDWDAATTFDFTAAGDLVSTLQVAIDEDTVALLLDGEFDGGAEIYIRTPRGSSRRGTTIDDQLLGFDASHLIRWDTTNGACLSGLLAPVSVVDTYPTSCERIQSAESEAGLEIAIPAAELGALTAGDKILIRIQAGSTLSPSNGPAEAPVPDIAGFDAVIVVNDPVGDDHGPGSYTYPTDAVFSPGSYDLVKFEAGPSESDAVFSFQIDAPVLNPWNSPVGLAIQSFDIYLDVDPGAGTGRQALVDGRNASLADANGWESAILVEGWDSAVATSRSDGTYSEADAAITVSVLVENGLVTVRVPGSSLPQGFDFETTGIAIALLGQEGFPSAGVRRVRDVTPTAEQWSFGGGDSAAGDTRILDALTPVQGEQETLLAEGILPVIVQ